MACRTSAACAPTALALPKPTRWRIALPKQSRRARILREADKRETRIFVQTHPDVLIIPPDPPQMLVKVDQVRHVIHEIYYKPVEGRERVYIFSDADFMKEAANSLLKVLEEPPEFATIFLLSDNPRALLPTIRSRCMHLRLAPVPADGGRAISGAGASGMEATRAGAGGARLWRRSGPRVAASIWRPISPHARMH